VLFLVPRHNHLVPPAHRARVDGVESLPMSVPPNGPSTIYGAPVGVYR
jgi:hypothetical protein